MDRPDLIPVYKARLIAAHKGSELRPTDLTLTVTDTIISETVIKIVEGIHEAEDSLRLVSRYP